MLRKSLVALGLTGAATGAAILAFPGLASAQDAPTAESVQEGVTALGQQTSLLWIVIGAVLVIFMQAGFALVETGFCRAEHAAHVMSTNFAIFGLGFVGFFIVGYAFMFAGYSYVVPGADFGYDQAVGGPLISYGRLPDGRWYEHNDTTPVERRRVVTDQVKQALLCEGYLYVYEKRP
jgi:Amt family ammonium transporter